MRKKTCLVLLSPEKASASELGSSLGAAGLTLPKSGKARANSHDQGHWESEKILQINLRLITALNRQLDDWRSFDSTELPDDAIEQFEAEIRTAIEEEFGGAHSIVLVYPRSYRFLVLYQNALEALGYEALFVHLFNDPAVGAKKSTYDTVPPEEHSALIWARDTLDSEVRTRGAKRVLLCIDNGSVLNRDLVQKLSAVFPEVFGERSAQSEVTHQKATQDAPHTQKTLSEIASSAQLTTEIFSAMRRLEADETDACARAQLDSLRLQFDRAEAILGNAYFQVLDHLEQHTSARVKKISVRPDENATSARQLNESFQAAVKFLRKPYKNALRHKLSRSLARFPLLSAKRRARLEKSAQKRDYKSLAARLRDVRFEIAPETDQDLAVEFINTLVPKRCKVILSDWHVAMTKALSTPEINSLPTITISLVTYNSAKWMDGFFDSLKNQNYPLSRLNLMFVDHGSKDETLAKIDGFILENGSNFGNVRLAERENNGFGAGHDYAIRQSPDSFILVSNVDLNFHKDTLTRLLAAALADQEDVASWEVRQCPYEHPKYYDPVTLETSWSSHACILMRRSAYLRVGGYEDRIFMYGEDVELSYKYRGAGYRLRYLPQVTVTHFVSFDEPELRAHQFGGSISANVLLRYRFGGAKLGQIGEMLLKDALDAETDTKRRAALDLAIEKIEQDKEHFVTVSTPEREVPFPFNGLDFDITRLGHDIQMQSGEPLIERPLVSIVTRTHGPNTAILSEAIASVLNQSYPNIEHLIVEDRTNFAKGLVETVKQTYRTNILYVKSEEAEGAGRSIAGNTGLAAAKGELLLFLDNDDLLFGDHVELLVRRLLANKNAVAAYSLAWNVPSHYSASGSYLEDPPLIPIAHLLPYTRERLCKGNFIPIQSILFKRSLYESLGGFDTQIDLLEDWNLWLKYSRAGDFDFVPKVTSLYRTPGDPKLKHHREKIMRDAE